jgi:hypothetical protein
MKRLIMTIALIGLTSNVLAMSERETECHKAVQSSAYQEKVADVKDAKQPARKKNGSKQR